MADGLELGGTVDVPGIGKLPTTYVVAGVAAAAGVVVWAWWSRRTAEEPEPTGGDYYADLRTGSAGKDGGYERPGSIDVDDTEDDDRAPRTNQEWTARVLDRLSWYEQGYASRVLSLYLDRQELTATEADVIREAWAQVGRPPEGDIPIRLKGTPATPVPTDPTPVPKVPAPRLHHVPRTRTTLQLQWYGVTGAKSYVAYCNGGGKRLEKRGITSTSYTFSGLKPDTTYSVSVAAFNSAGVRSSTTSNVVTIRTKK